ncbi:hypothetical protein SAMN05192529_102106 [Arachidicoccus rhizosphaerae]|uniref:Phage replication protein O n=1 Tax=Arachidicoccus rhizosphaerae TaxID=551991 RepID=A0A1H3W5I4_9BACT|nr:hypothetical protein [Arachidicoccus rhizosphaerae]SDZ81694.1 hypothetical protein SAMN05192529_102106 [Arachidicoccus rhizosphaerae]
MPNRVLRDWTDSERINELSVNAECLFVRLMMKADDYGNFNANSKLVKSLCFPLKDFREADITRWIQELETSGLIALYEADNKKYLHIINFGQRLRTMNPKFPQYIDNQQTGNPCPQPAVICPQPAVICPPETKRNEVETNIDTKVSMSTVVDEKAPLPYDSVEKTKTGIWEYLKTGPKEAEPYVDFWNLFAAEKGVPKVRDITRKRRQKLKVRLGEKSFNFCNILKMAGNSEFLLSHGWFAFDWIIENDSNYLKILEGNYQPKEKNDQKEPVKSPKIVKI